MGCHRFYGYGYDSGLFFGLSLNSLIAGIIVVIGALMLNARPVHHMTYCIVGLIPSAVSFASMRGYMIGVILGIPSGDVVLSYR